MYSCIKVFLNFQSDSLVYLIAFQCKCWVKVLEKKTKHQQTGKTYHKPPTEIAVLKEELNSSSQFVKDFACSPRKKRKTMQMQ